MKYPSKAMPHRACKPASALFFIIEEQPAAPLLAAAIESGDERFEGAAIRTLYESERYPLARRAGVA